jgi:hypothetical protein
MATHAGLCRTLTIAKQPLRFCNLRYMPACNDIRCVCESAISDDPTFCFTENCGGSTYITSQEVELRLRVSASFCALIACFAISAATAADQGQIDQITNVVERFCLSGKQIQFTADASGNIAIKSLTPGAQGKVEVNIRNTRGGVGYFNEEIRRVVDDDTRKCMQPYIDRIINVILDRN